MATGAVALPAVNGTHVPTASDLAEYQKLIKLHDAVFAGQHPRLKPLSATTATSNQATTANAQAINSNGKAHASYNPSSLEGPATQPYLNPLPLPQSNGQLMPAALQGFDPKVLDKSPLLIATESNISRAELDAAVQNEVKRRSTAWPKLDRENILPEFDVDDILQRAQESVRPVLIDVEKLAAKEKSPAKSVDEQSYYSSQAHDDEADDANDSRAQLASKPCVYYFKGKCNRGGACKFSHDPAFAAQLKPNLTSTESEKPYANTGNGGHANKKQKRDDSRHGQQSVNAINLVDDSPASAKRRADEQYQRDLARAAHGPNPNFRFEDAQYVPPPPPSRRLPPQDRRFSGRGMTPTRDVPVVRSTITSPLAPQPARVSPLAMKGPSYMDKVRISEAQGPSPHLVPTPGRHSPPVNQQTLTRKRRRETNPQNAPEGANVRRRVGSPEVRIKDEPVSPKLMDALPRYVPREEIVRRPVDVDAYSPRGGRVEARPVREVHYIDEPGFHRVSSPVRVVSRAELRHEVRREPDLRRVVSERQLVRAESPSIQPREPVYYNDAGRPTQVSPREVYVSRSDADLHSAYRASVAPTGPPNGEYAAEQRRGRSPPPQHQPNSMAPPPVRRIVRDQYGNEYYERIIQDPPRYSVAPEPRYAGEPTYIGRPASRIGSVVPESARQFHEAGTVQRRIDPEPTSPRYAEYPPQSTARAPSVGPNYQPEYAAERPQVVRLGEYPREERYERVIHEPARPTYTERPREVYYEDAPREGTYRVQSVRPEATRYIEADDRYARQASVRPAVGYERAAHSMAPPPPPRYEYADDRSTREYHGAGNGPQYID